MNSLYVDTSALARVLLDQPDSLVIEHELGRFARRVSSRLMGIELRRVALRDGLGDRVDEMLGDISFIPLDEALLAAAERIEPAGVATPDAIHLATAVQLAGDGEVDAIMTYDLRLAEGARHHGIEVVSPA